jgi:hypothetical protein
MSSLSSNRWPADVDLGVLPLAGPVPYLTLSAHRARTLMHGPRPTIASTWVHATSIDGAVAAAHYGLIPSCWHGGDGCVVFGSSAPEDVHPARGIALVQVRSCAIAGQLRAWWVPRAKLRGASIDGKFVSAKALRAAADSRLADVRPCSCPLADLVQEQQELWRRTVTSGERPLKRGDKAIVLQC